MDIHSLIAAEQFFTTDFYQCRQRFQNAMQLQKALPVEEKSWALPNREAGDLHCDAALIGNPEASQVLVIISGTHGVEGYCGSAIQQFLLQTMAAPGFVLSDNLAVVFVHGLNPWGMLWARRCDQQGIDLNRNVVDFSRPPQPHPDYLEVLECLTITDPGERKKQLKERLNRWGQQHFDKVFSGGQYTHPWAPFYGGRQPAFAGKIVDELINGWALEQRELIVIDLHTGLGPWAYGELISDHPVGSAGNAYSRRLFGAAVAITAEGASFSVEKSGLQDYRWHPLMEEAGCFITLEFGTYGTDALFDTLLGEHLFWHHNPQPAFSDPQYQKYRQAMQAHFCPRDLLWQQAALFKAWQVFNTVILASS